MMAGHWTTLDHALATAPADHPAQIWRGLLELGPVALCWPDYSHHLWILVTDTEQARLLHRQAEIMITNHPEVRRPVVVPLGFFHRVTGAETIEEAAQVLLEIGSRCTPPEERDATKASLATGDSNGPDSGDTGGTSPGPGDRVGEPEGHAGECSDPSRTNLSRATEGDP
jgi:hypothetical protein